MFLRSHGSTVDIDIKSPWERFKKPFSHSSGPGGNVAGLKTLPLRILGDHSIVLTIIRPDEDKNQNPGYGRRITSVVGHLLRLRHAYDVGLPVVV